MATDTLEIFGTEYTGVTGVKATDSSNQIKTYIRPQGTKSISANGTGIDVTNYASVDVSVGSPSPTLQSKTKSYTPTETQQTETVSADNGYDGLDEVEITVGAISSTYVGSGIDRRDDSDLVGYYSGSDYTFETPAGYYQYNAYYNLAGGTEGTPTATKSAVNNHALIVTPSVTNTAGYISGGTHTGTAVSVSASELVSGTKSISTNGTGIDVTNYASVNVSVDDSTFIVTLSWDDDYFDEGEGAWVPDKTYTEIQTAYNAGRSIVVNAQNAEDSSADGVFNNSEGYLFYSVRWLASVAGGDGQIECFYQMTSDGVSETNRWEYIETPYDNINITQAGETDVTNYATATVPSGTAGTPTATKGTVSNHSVSVTPSVTNTTGYITGSTKTGTAVTVSASELVSGTYSVTSSGTKDVTNYASASVPALTLPTAASTVSSGTNKATISRSTSNQYINIPTGFNNTAQYYTVSAVADGTAGNPTATKGTVSNNSISVTPTVTNTTGYITGGTKTGTAVTISASELVSGSQTVTTNDTYDVTNLAELVVNVSGGGIGTMTIDTKTTTLSASASSISFTGLSGNPLSFVVTSSADLTTGGTKAAAVAYDGTSLHGMDVTTQAEADTGFTKSYSSGTLTITATSATFEANEYKLVYAYGGLSSDIHTADVQVGSGATSITFSGLSGRPLYFSCVFKSSFSTSSGYQRVIAVASDDGGAHVHGLEMDSSAHYSTAHWTSSYNNGSLTITSNGTNQGGYFHQPGYYQLTYAVDPNALTFQNKTGVGASTSSQTIYADSGYDALESVQINPVSQTNLVAGNIKSGTTISISNGSTNLWSVTGTYTGGGGSASVATTTWSNSSTSTVSHQFTGLLGTPIAAFLRCTSQLTRSSSNTYYYIADIVWDGTDARGNYHLRSNGSYNNVASDATAKYNVTVGTNSITFSSTASSRSSAPGSFYNGTYELTYIY